MKIGISWAMQEEIRNIKQYFSESPHQYQTTTIAGQDSLLMGAT